MEAQVLLLREQIEETELHLRNLKSELQRAEQKAEATHQTAQPDSNVYQPGEKVDKLGNEFGSDQDEILESNECRISSGASTHGTNGSLRWPLRGSEFKRYGRQLIMPEVGLPGQLRLKNRKVLIVGAGGLGCPAAAYLAGAGVGTLGLMDGDTVELSNLHRQIAHSTDKIGMSKVDSAYDYLQACVAYSTKYNQVQPINSNFFALRLNPGVCYNRYRFHVTPEKAISIFEQYDMILDCTDHPTSRYLISDACILTGKPLVSASALRTEGQLIILNDPPKPPGDPLGGPCYRCIFPKPPPAENVLSCGEGGILGPVVGVMGVLQALEAIKVLTRKTSEDHSILSHDSEPEPPANPSMLMFSAYSNPQFRTVRMRRRRRNCAACSSEATIIKKSLESGSLDYIAFCGAAVSVNILPPHLRISAGDFALLQQKERVLIDTRDETQFAICALPGSINVPWTGNADTWLDRALQSAVLPDDGRTKYVVCRFGNDSQLAAQAIMSRANHAITVKDIKGGLQTWREEVDPDWPDY